MKRLFDFTAALLALVILMPFFLLIALIIIIASKGGVFYAQTRVGKGQKHFHLLKFRTMVPEADKSGELTIGIQDPRITRFGSFLRKYKLDELPQLLNILAGEMSFVGPRPEVPKYVALYNEEQLKVLTVRPGLTDYASLEYINENEILGKSADPEHAYLNAIMPAKLKLNLKYIEDQCFILDMRIILKTLKAIFS
jgi:lipopolysaccharide/colanic/teichoic acid biosynthesis glycosyltransferase